jgi:hypothetical protein
MPNIDRLRFREAGADTELESSDDRKLLAELTGLLKLLQGLFIHSELDITFGCCQTVQVMH